jgi:glucose-1-phosphate cytidylyltransferase
VKVVILAGGKGTRLAEETRTIPKPMVRIGGRPLIWHIMKHYADYGYNDFVIACGYKGYVIKEYFANYLIHESDLSVRLGTGETTVLSPSTQDWTVTLADTGTTR